MPPEELPLACPLSLVQNARGLNALRFGLERALEVACGWVATTPETELKVQLGKVIWHAASAADLLATRLEELQGLSERPVASGPLYTAFTNALLAVEDSQARMALLHELVLPDLLRALRAHREAVRSTSDSLTEWALGPGEARLEALLAWYPGWLAGRGCAHAGGEAAERARELFRASGGVVGPAASSLPEPLAALARSEPTPEVAPRVHTPARASGLQIIDPVGPPPSSFTMFVHSTIFNIEVSATELCARMIIEHREAPWKLRLDLARQAYDEVRHAEVLLGRLGELGGKVGEFPIDLRVWRSFQAGESLAEQLLIQQRIGEGAGLDGGYLVAANRQQQGDERTARIFDYINADEINHVRLGNRWARHLLGGDEAALAALERKALEKLEALGCRRPPVRPWVKGRRMADFTEQEISSAVATWEELEGQLKAQRPAGRPVRR